MSFSKMVIEVFRGKLPEPVEIVPVLFNPNRISWQKQVPWDVVPRADSNVAVTQFTHGQPSTLSLDLFFDTYASRQDVSHHTSKIYRLASVFGHNLDEEPPPSLRLRWGLFSFHDLYWVLTQVDQNFSLFLEDGTPVRATLNCSFQEKERQGSLGSSGATGSGSAPGEGGVAAHLVKGAETLSAIHGRYAGDVSSWRETAVQNGIWNPRRLATGGLINISAPGGRTRR